jgi:hypothetical protein
MAEWKKVLVSGSSIEIRDITGSLGLRPSQSVVISASAAITAPTAINQVAIQSNNRYALLTSQSAYFYNHNAGYPTSNAWGSNLQGSYFNNFNANTDVSEILRFVAGLLSQSAPDASPNTKTFGGITARNIATTPLSIDGRVPSESTNSNILYLQSKGFANSGSASFFGLGTVYNAATFAIDYSSSAAGNGSGVSSSNDLQLFGLGSKTDTVYISASTIFKFYSSSNETLTTNTSTSQALITLESENELDQGAIRRTISTANPTVIPSAYQDGRFTGSFSSSYNPVTFTAASSGSTGWYHFTQSITIYTGSQTVAQGVNFTTASRVFRSAYLDSTFSANTITHIQTTASLTAISRSLSGAPYLSQSTYLYICTSSGVFNPLYSTQTTILSTTTGSTGFLSRSFGSITCSINSDGTIGTANVVYSSSIATVAKVVNAYPSQNDVIEISASFVLNPTAGASGSAQTGFISANTGSFISSSAFGRNNGATGSGIFLNYFTPGAFGQPAASGTMALYNRFQGYDGGDLADSSNTGSEFFTGESFRIKITDNLLSGSYLRGDKFVTGTFDISALASTDLQVKPGYLVDPGGQYRYWITGSATSNNKYYARAFQRTASATSLKINLGKILINWDDDSNGVAAVLIFSSSAVGSLAGTPRFFDPTETTFAGLISASMTAGTFKNPFGTPIDLYGNNNGSLNGTTYTMTLYDSSEMKLNGGSYKDFILLIRYKGDPLPVSGAIITY